MTLREIDRQHEHWRRWPPASILLARIAVVAGCGVPDPDGGGASPAAFVPSNEDEMRALASMMGVSLPAGLGGARG